MKGIVFGIQSFSTDDGPGIRTTVFLKGCNMHCVWCHNPESISGKRELMFTASKCTFCGACISSCLTGVHTIRSNEHTLERSKCVACGKCTEVCYAEALVMAGWMADEDEIIDIAKKDLRYFNESGGGLTISGGEPMFQFPFTLSIAKKAVENNIRTAIETNGSFPIEQYEQLLPWVELFLIDYKVAGENNYQKYTGVPEYPTLECIKHLNTAGASIILRCPIIPGVNDRSEHFRVIADMTKRFEHILGFEIMPYHKLGISKSLRLGNKASVYEVPGQELKKSWEDEIVSYGGRVWIK